MWLLFCRWRCDHERDAKTAYLEEEGPKHRSLTLRDTSCLISRQYPFIGATPDGLLHCECCGDRLLEVECPYCCKDGLDPTGLPKQFCLAKMQERWHLKRDHQYFFQVQAQLNVWGSHKGVFVVWNKEGIVGEERVRDEQFFAETAPSVTGFFTKGVLPEIVGECTCKTSETSEMNPVQHFV